MADLFVNKLIDNNSINEQIKAPIGQVIIWATKEGVSPNEEIVWYSKDDKGVVRKMSSDGNVSKQYVDDQLATKLENPDNGNPGQILMKTASGVKWVDFSGGGSEVNEFSPTILFALENPVGGGAPGNGLMILKRPRFNAVNTAKFKKEINSENITNPIEG